MQFVNGLFSKILWGLLILVLLAGGYIFLVRNLVKPPQIATTPTQPNSTLPPPTPSNSNPSPQVTGNNVDDFNPTLVDETNAIDPEEDMLPALAQAEDVVLEMPEKLEPGGVLKVFLDPEKTKNHSSFTSSPIQVYNTGGLEFVYLEDIRKFQEVEGYFQVKETGYYNFLVNIPEDWNKTKLGVSNLRILIDGFTLDSSLGGKVYLEKGWHKIGFFNAWVDIEEHPVVVWASAGEAAKPLKVWREVVEKETETEQIEERPQELDTSEE